MRNCFSVLYCISWVERKLQQYIALKQLAIDDDGGGGGKGVSERVNDLETRLKKMVRVIFNIQSEHK